MTKKQKREELAKQRLQKLTKKGMMPCVYDDYINNEGLIYYSERTPLGGILYWANDMGGCNELVVNEIEKLKTKDVTPYHVTHEYLDFGECWDIWCITDEDLEYGEEEFDEDNITFSYVVNATEPSFSEYGSIRFDIAGGGAVRTA